MSGKKDNSKDDEDSCGCFADARTKKTCPPVRNVTHPLRYYEFTQEEIKALEECDKESFYQRCLPLSTLFATVTYAAIRSGVLKRNPHFASFPKVMIAALLGYVYGRISYLSECDKKLRCRLSRDSHLGVVLRKYHAENIEAQKPKSG